MVNTEGFRKAKNWRKLHFCGVVVVMGVGGELDIQFLFEINS